MPRRGRGQAAGEEAKAYPNRTDLQDAAIVPGGTVGDREQLEAAIAATPDEAGGVAPPPAPPPRQMTPDDVPNLLDPSAVQQEPVQAGLNRGPGAGPEAIASLNPKKSLEYDLRAAYRAYPTPGLLRLIRRAQGT